MGKRKPNLTVLLPVYNCEKYVGSAVESVLNQSFKDFEFLIINDGSTDGTESIIKRYARDDSRIRFVSRSNKGFLATLAEGLDLIETELVMRMDADDISLPTRMEKQYRFLVQNPDYGVVGCEIQSMSQDGRMGGYDPRPAGNDSLRLFLGYGCALSGPTVMFRKSVISSVGGFREESWPAEDYDCWARIALKYPDVKLHNIPEVLYYYRENNEGISLQNKVKQIQKTIEIGDMYRSGIIGSNRVFLSARLHRDWVKDAYSRSNGNDVRLMEIYYTAMSWFINDLHKNRRFIAFLKKLQLSVLTKIYNPQDRALLSNRPTRHTFPKSSNKGE